MKINNSILLAMGLAGFLTSAMAQTPGEPPEKAVLRASLMKSLGHIGRDEEVLAQARELQSKESENPTSVEANLADAVVPLAAVEGGTRSEHLHCRPGIVRHRDVALGEIPEQQALAHVGVANQNESRTVCRCTDDRVCCH